MLELWVGLGWVTVFSAVSPFPSCFTGRRQSQAPSLHCPGTPETGLDSDDEWNAVNT